MIFLLIKLDLFTCSLRYLINDRRFRLPTNINTCSYLKMGRFYTRYHLLSNDTLFFKQNEKKGDWLVFRMLVYNFRSGKLADMQTYIYESLQKRFTFSCMRVSLYKLYFLFGQETQKKLYIFTKQQKYIFQLKLEFINNKNMSVWPSSFNQRKLAILSK